MKPESASDRPTALRRLLVETVEATPALGRRVSSRLIVAAIATFALAGAGTGGLVSAAALAHDNGSTAGDQVVTAGLQEGAMEYLADTNSHIFGAATILVGRGNSSVQMGDRPDGADSIVLGMQCMGPADVVVTIATHTRTLHCSGPDAAVGGVGRVAVDAGPLTLKVRSAGGYAVWVAFTDGAPAPDPDPSAAQAAELGDDVITEQEYLDAFDRYSACMTQHGYPLSNVDTSVKPPRFAYGPDNGTEAEVTAAQKATLYCFPYEFAYVEVAWDKAHPQ